MQSMLAAEFAILVHLKSVRIVLLVFGCVIISLLALGADQSNFDSCVISHSLVPPMLKLRLRPCADKGLPRTSLRDGSLSLAPDKGITKKPIHRGINIVSCPSLNVNSFWESFSVDFNKKTRFGIQFLFSSQIFTNTRCNLDENKVQ